MLDATNRMRRRLAGRLEPGEAVLAAASVHRLGTTTDALLGAAAAIATESGATTFRPSPSTSTGGAGGWRSTPVRTCASWSPPGA